MDINNNTHTNIFTKGMNTDTSDMLLGPELYREAVNLRLSTNKDGNDGELHMIEGTDFVYKIERIQTGYTFDKILKICSIRNKIVIVARYIAEGIDADEYKWCVITIDDDQITKVTNWIKCGPNWGSGLNVVTSWESDENVYLYIADGENPIWKVNLNGDSTLSIDNMTSYQSGDLDPVTATLSTTESGELVAGKVQYTYRIYNQHTTISQLSPISNVVSIYKNSNSGYAEGKKSSKAILISGLPTDNRCLIFRIHYISAEQPPVITMIYDGKLTSSTYIDRGTENVSTLSLAEYTSLKTNLILKPKIIESKDEYLYAANIRNVDNKFSIDISDIISDPLAYFAIIFELQTSGERLEIGSESDRQPCFRNGETYRFGIIFYDQNGNKSEVVHICDLTVNIENYQYVYISNGVCKSNKIYAKFLVLRLLPSGISKIEIVRAERLIENKKAITSGILGATLKNNTADYNNFIYPSYFMTMLDIKYKSSYSYLNQENINFYSSSDVLQFSSPEITYNKDYTIDILSDYKNLIKIKDSILFGSSNISVSTSDNDYVCTNNNYPNTYSDLTQYKGIPIMNVVLGSSNVFTTVDFYLTYVDFMEDHNYTMNTTQQAYFNIVNAFSVKSVGNNSYNISDFKYIEPPQYNKFKNSDSDLRINDDLVTIGEYSYIPWTSYYLSTKLLNELLPYIKDAALTTSSVNYALWCYIYMSRVPLSTTGKSIIMIGDSSWRSITTSGLNTASNILSIDVVDIIKDNVASYNDKCKYISFGDYSYYINNQWQDVILNSGDSYIQMFEYNASHVVYDNVYKQLPTACIIYRIPVVSYVDMSAEYGTSFTKQGENYKIQDKACAFLDYVQDKSCYLYNPIYGDIDLVNHSFEKYEDEAEITSRDATIYVSLKKENGEIIDNWLLFKPADFLDLSYKYGQITGLTTFNNQLIAWQEDATAIVSTNERQLVNSTTDTEIVLGTGGPLARYDYITTKYGMRENQFCHAKSNTTLYWWDYDRRELLEYAGGQQVVPLTTVKNLRNYINSKNNINNPKLFYDHKYKELISTIVGTKSLVYNEAAQVFTSLYEFTVGENTEVDGDIFIANGSSIYQWNISSDGKCLLYGEEATPSLTYIVNDRPQYVKVYDNMILGGSIYGDSEKISTRLGDSTSNSRGGGRFPILLSPSTDSSIRYANVAEQDLTGIYFRNVLNDVTIDFTTPLNQEARVKVGDVVTINEHDFRLAVPRRNLFDGNTKNIPYGNRMRGKTMECTLKSSNNSTDFSLQYIITKYRMSWS